MWSYPIFRRRGRSKARTNAVREHLLHGEAEQKKKKQHTRYNMSQMNLAYIYISNAAQEARIGRLLAEHHQSGVVLGVMPAEGNRIDTTNIEAGVLLDSRPHAHCCECSSCIERARWVGRFTLGARFRMCASP